MLLAATSAPAGDQGWIYEVLRWAGVGPVTAHHVQSVLVRPLTVVLIFVVALLALWLGQRAIRHWIGGAARRAAQHADSPRATARASTITALLSSIWRVVVVTVAFFVALATFGIDLTPLLAGATVVGATIGFGAQTIVRDLLAGFLIIIEGQYDIGDALVVGDTRGTVEDLSLRVTRLRGLDGSMWFVPNGEIRKLSNVTRGWAEVTVDAVVPAGCEVDTVLDAASAAASALEADSDFDHVLLERPHVLGIVAADSSTLTARIQARVPPARRDQASRFLGEALARNLRAEGVFTSDQGPPATSG
jgi:moderate conductance mechanosensitive channel